MLLSDIIDGHDVHRVDAHLPELDWLISKYKRFSVGIIEDITIITTILDWVHYNIQKLPKNQHILLNSRLLVRIHWGRVPMVWIVFDDHGNPVAGETRLINDSTSFLNAVVMELALS